MITVLLCAIAVLLLLCTGLAWVVVLADRALKSRAVRLHHQAERIRDLRAEAQLLAQAVDELAAKATPAPVVPAEPPLPRWGHRVLRDIQTATSPADFDRKDNR